MKEIYFILFALLLSQFSCRKQNCVSVEIGRIDLDDNSLSFSPCEDGEKVEFINEAGSTKIFMTELVYESFTLCQNSICNSVGPLVDAGCEYYRGQLLRTMLQAIDENLLIELVGSVESYLEESRLFYDYFSATLNGEGQFARGEYISHVHFDTSIFKKEKSKILEELKAKPSIELNGLTFQNILHTEESENMIYLQKGEGVVGLKLDGVVWVKK